MEDRFSDLLWMAALIPVTILIVGLMALAADLRRDPGSSDRSNP